LGLVSIEELGLRQQLLPELAAMFAGILAFLALTLSRRGIYGVMAYLVTQQTREIGYPHVFRGYFLRVLRGIIIRVLQPVFVGMILGLLAAAALSAALHTTLVFPVPLTSCTV